ncbi:MAG: beta-lactamase family protein [Nitrososphaerota archaeon]|nr:beta-lactamase family protein [Nitrososphaerota archaeon]
MQSYGGDAVRRDSIFRISSMTRPVTAVVTMILVDGGKVELEDPVASHLPELAGRRVLGRPDGPSVRPNPQGGRFPSWTSSPSQWGWGSSSRHPERFQSRRR